MKIVLVAAVALVVGASGALAQGAGPAPAPFMTWQQEGAAGHRMTPLSELERAARSGVSMGPAQTTAAQNGQMPPVAGPSSGRAAY